MNDIKPVDPDCFVPNRFRGSVALVTGGGSGIGEACALRIAREGARVVVADIGEQTGRAVAEAIVASGGEALFVQVDVCSRDSCEAMVAEAIDRFGRLDVALNAAGVMDGGGSDTPAILHLATEGYLRRTIEVNLFGAINSCAAELGHFVSRGDGGVIVNVGSMAALTGSAGTPAYVASKHGVSGLTRAIAIDYAPYGIRCNSVNMAPTETPMFARAMAHVGEASAAVSQTGPRPAIKSRGAIPRNSTPWEQAAVILFAASTEASNMTGALIAADGGWTAY
jgi:NAD(P)-dependent dehydrogenase (short-subunit alcohol dehydrogenase family)